MQNHTFLLCAPSRREKLKFCLLLILASRKVQAFHSLRTGPLPFHCQSRNIQMKSVTWVRCLPHQPVHPQYQPQTVPSSPVYYPFHPHQPCTGGKVKNAAAPSPVPPLTQIPHQVQLFFQKMPCQFHILTLRCWHTKYNCQCRSPVAPGV